MDPPNHQRGSSVPLAAHSAVNSNWKEENILSFNSVVISTLRVWKEGNIENRHCYCIWIDYDDDNKEVEEEEEEEKGEEKEEKVQGNRRQFLNMALTLMGYNEIWLKSNNTIGLMHKVIQ